MTDLLRAALDGSGPALAPVPTPQDRPSTATVPEPVALVVRTTGSTADPREVMLDADALLASARATAQRLAGPGRWILALPLIHIAGIQVLVRSIDAGTTAVVLPPGSFDPEGTAHVVDSARTPGTPLYTALVPNQLRRILSHAGPDGRLPPRLRAWTCIDAILVGGDATTPTMLERAHDAGLHVVTTYGMTETAGGCVYDGIPLAGVTVRVDDAIHIAGPVLARGYIGQPDGDDAFTFVDGVRWLRTRDTGTVVGGVLRVHGRLDDAIITGGTTVAPAEVEAALCTLAGITDACVVGVPDEAWGQVVTAVVVPATGVTPSLADVRSALTPTLGPAATPRRLILVDTLAHSGSGKVDRAAVVRLAASRTSVPPTDRPQPRPDPRDITTAHRTSLSSRTSLPPLPPT